MKKEYQGLFNNTKLFAIGNIVSKLSQYVIIALCSYRLSDAEFGISDTIIQTCAMLVPVVSADIADGLFRFSMDKNYSREQVISNAMLINIFGTIIALAVLPIEYMFLKNIWIAFFISILTVFELFQVSIKEFVRGLGLTKVYMFSGFINALMQIVSCFLYVYLLNLGITGYILTIATSFVSEILYCFFKVNIFKYIRIKSISKRILIDLLKYSFPLAPNKIMWWIISASDRYFVLWILGASATGLYSMSAKFPALITIVLGFFFQAWQISAIEANEKEEKNAFYSKIFNLLWSTIGIITALGLVFIRFIVRIFVADSFFHSWEYAPFLLVAAAFSAIQTFFGVNYTTAKDSLGALKTTSVAAICNLALNFMLINLIGIQGATIATLLSYIIISIYRFIDTKKYVEIKLDNRFGFCLTYLTLLLECVMLFVNPQLYLFTILGLLIVLIVNRKTCFFLISFVKSYIFKSKSNLENNEK